MTDGWQVAKERFWEFETASEDVGVGLSARIELPTWFSAFASIRVAARRAYNS